MAFDPAAEPVAYASHAKAVEAVVEGACALALLPVHNSTAGRVETVLELVARAGLRAAGEVLQPVRMELLGLRGAAVGELAVVTSHPVALAQCRRVIAELGLREESAVGTATAAEEVARLGDRARCALASPRAAELFGLEVLRSGVGDDPAAVTRFVAFVTGQR